MSRHMHLRTLGSRVTTWYVSLLAAALIVFGASLYLGLENYMRASTEHALRADAQAISSIFVAQEEAKGPVWMQGEIAEAYAPEIAGRFIRVLRRDGTVLYQSGDMREPRIISSAVRLPRMPTVHEGFREESAGAGIELKVYTMPYVAASGTRYLVEVGASTAPTRRVLASLLKILLLMTPSILLVAAVGGHLLLTSGLQPLVVLTAQAERIGAQQLGERLAVAATGDEMERLTLSLNRMIGRLEEALAHDRRFSADVSHELRTPLTILRGELEQMLGAPEVTPAQRETLGSALEEIDRMTKIVESLLTIARLDAGTDGMQMTPVDLGQLARWTADQMHLLAEEKSIHLESLEASSVTVMADAGRIKQVLVNLLDNAIKYTPCGGTVTVSVKTARLGRTAVVEVRDTGIGIPRDSIPFVFERFYRADKARTRETGGAGLGLSIVKAISKAHQGAITIESAEGAGTQVRFELPTGSPALRAQAAAPRSG